MKSFALLSAVYLCSFVNAFMLSGSQKTLEDSLTVPGDNPLEYCDGMSDSILSISNVDLTPNPPIAGKTLTIRAKGNFTEKIENGAYINLVVKYGLIKLVNQKTDLCEQMKNIDEECPLEGVKVITKDVDLPAQIPPGHYNVFADVYTVDDKSITCLKASVNFYV